MDCPYCGKEMWEGMLTTGSDNIFWEGLDLERQHQRILLSKTTLSGEGSPACFCPTCRKLVMDVPQLRTVWERIKEGVDTVGERVSEALDKLEEAKQQRDEEKKRGKDPWEW